jgi:hypothetical protein
MSPMTLAQTNGSAAHPPMKSTSNQAERDWLQLSVQAFFEPYPWDGRPIAPPPQPNSPRTTAPPPQAPSFTSSVSQFFEWFPWEGAAIIAAPLPTLEETTAVDEESPITANDLTLDDFSGLFG